MAQAKKLTKERALSRKAPPPRQGVQSFELGMKLFQTLVSLKGAATLAELSAASGMTASSAHKYCVSMIRTGLIEADGRGRYKIGPYLYTLTNPDTWLERAQILAGELLPDLVRQVQETSFLSIWSPTGPMVLKVHESDRPVTVRILAQHRYPLSNTCAGRVFAAFLDQEKVAPLVDAELKQRATDAAILNQLRKQYEQRIAEVRRRFLSRATPERYAGLNSVSAPIFDRNGKLAFTITSFGPTETCSIAWDGPVAQALKAFANEVMQQMGGRYP
ncbi:IclR family transcriptional regulator C-terminal domain-containing protein [Methylocella sp. CPCC 101449]|uniref:IclR family transcriptional regulator n=1 Tax=Methylocella sp. CPCC 101449 TaxID=2987531 RepID=UPI00288CFD33|nr:IclR family transcriptional regulator C-terminal domain-containing protein [Methylocella sp. CPCC 101449]MDT2021240.1 helix-turn-helix domain-containing protein [Methylocella sp. CPCC 101449]